MSELIYIMKKEITQLYTPNCKARISVIDGRKQIVVESEEWVVLKNDNVEVIGRGFKFDTQNQYFEIRNDVKITTDFAVSKDSGDVLKTKRNLLHLIILCTLNLNASLLFGQNDKEIKILQSDSGDLINSYEDLLDMDPFDELIKLMEELKSEAQVDSNLLIIAKSVQFNNQFQNMVLDGNVELIHNDMFISSEEVSAKFSDDGDLLVLEAKDDVYLKHNNRTITCEILSYHPMNKKIKTQGSSSIEVKGNLIKAEQISGFISPNGYLIFEPNVWLDISQINNQPFGIDIRSEKAIFRNSNQEFASTIKLG